MSNSNSLKTHSEVKYSNNLSSSEIWKVLVALLYEAAAPLSVYGNMSVETGLSCLALSTNNRRKISEENSETFLSDIFYELSLRVTDDTQESRLSLLEYILTRGVERNVIVDHIVFSLSTMRCPPEIDKGKLRSFVAQYLEDYEKFKQDIMFRYYNLTESHANKNQRAKSITGLNVHKGDMFNVYVISAMRAIDRFIPTKGTLTSYIEQWFQNAKGSSDYIVYDGEALSVNRTVRRQLQEGDLNINTKSIPLEDRENSIPDEFNTEERMNSTYPEFSRHVARLPNSTIMFLALNLPYILTKEQIERLK